MCKVEGCDKPGKRVRGMCYMHYTRWRRHGDPNFTFGLPEGEGLRFLDGIADADTDECILWPYRTDDDGYGRTKINGKGAGAHRASLILATGEDPPELHAAHSCGIRLCVNPRHLRWATPKENVQDGVQSGRHVRGRRVSTRKLHALHVRLIMQDDRPAPVIAKEYGISKSNVWSIKTGRSWSWLTGIQPPAAWKREKREKREKRA